MTKVDPAQFVVRRNDYQQVRGYPEACAKVTEALLEQPPMTFAQAFDFIVDRIKTDPVLNRDIESKASNFGSLRESSSLHLRLDDKYAADARELKKRYAKSIKGTQEPPSAFTYQSAAHPHLENGIELSRIKLPADSAAHTWVVSPEVGDSEHKDEHRWSVISSTFAVATNKALDKDQREKAALECYAILGQDRTLARAQATLSNIVLQYLSHEAGFETPFAKKETDVHVKSLTRPVETFVKEWKSGEYFDANAKPEEVMGWHRRRAKADNQQGLG